MMRAVVRASVVGMAVVASAVAALLLFVEVAPLREIATANQALFGAAFGFVVSFVVQAWRDGRLERRAVAAEARADERKRRDAKGARVRDAYQTVLMAAWGMQSARVQMIAGDTEPNRKVVDAILKETGAGINKAHARLALEQDTEDVRDAFREIYLAFGNYIRDIRATDQEVDRAERAKYLKEDREKVEKGTAALEDLIRAKVAEV